MNILFLVFHMCIMIPYSPLGNGMWHCSGGL